MAGTIVLKYIVPRYSDLLKRLSRGDRDAWKPGAWYAAEFACSEETRQSPQVSRNLV